MKLYQGFTLIELIVAIAIIGIIVTLALGNFKSYLGSSAEIEMISFANSAQVAYNIQLERGYNCTDAAACIGSAVLATAFPIKKDLNVAYAINSALPGVGAGKKLGFYVSFDSMNCARTTPSSTKFRIVAVHCNAYSTSSGGTAQRGYIWTENCSGVISRGFQTFIGVSTTYGINGTC